MSRTSSSTPCSESCRCASAGSPDQDEGRRQKKKENLTARFLSCPRCSDLRLSRTSSFTVTERGQTTETITLHHPTDVQSHIRCHVIAAVKDRSQILPRSWCSIRFPAFCTCVHPVLYLFSGDAAPYAQIAFIICTPSVGVAASPTLEREKNDFVSVMIRGLNIIKNTGK